MKFWLIRLIFLTFCVGLPLVSGEIFVRLMVTPSAQDKANFEDGLEKILEENFSELQGPQMGIYIAHPFWGFQMNPGLAHVNNFGFHDTEMLPYRRGENEFLLGLFGGSVASRGYKAIRDAIEKSSELRCGRRLKLLNFANDGYAQPSQMNIAMYFIENLDATINLDGNNEVMATRRYTVPVNYPEFYHEMYFMVPEKELLLNKAFAMEKRQHFLAKTLLGFKFFLKSDLIYYLSYRATNWLEAKKWDYLTKTEMLTPSQQKMSARFEQMKQGLASWEKYTLMQSRLEKATNNIPAYFFIQPSQYSPDGKVFSEEEKTKVFHPTPQRVTDFKNIFAALRSSGQKLQRQGVDIIDLISLFSQDGGTIFTDSCCHLNERGEKILAERIAAEVVARVNGISCERR